MKVTITSLPQPKQVTITGLPQAEETQQQFKPESFGQQAARTATATGIKGAGNAFNLASLGKGGLLALGSLFGMEEPKLHQQLIDEGKAPRESLQEQLQQKSGYTAEELQPRNFGENVIQRFGSSAPFAALGGLPGLATSAIGSGVAAGAGELGAPEGLQDLIQIGTELGTGVARGKIPTWGKHKAALYAKEPAELQKLAKIKQAEKLGEAFKKADYGLTIVNDSAKKIISDAGMRVESAFKGGADAEKLLDLGSQLYNDALSLSGKNKGAATYLHGFRLGIKESLKQAVKDPNWYNGLSPARQLTLFEKTPLWIEDAVKWGASVLPKQYVGKAPQDIIDKVAKLAAIPERVVKILQVPAVRQYHYKLLKSLATGSPEGILKSASLLNKVASKYSEEEEV